MKNYAHTHAGRSPLLWASLIVIAAGAVLLPATLQGAPFQESLVNGSFDEVLVGWEQPAALAGQALYIHEGPGGHCDLHTQTPGYHGTVLRHNLNIPGIADQTVDVSIDLRMPWESGTHTAAVYLEFSKTDGSVARALVLNPENATIVGDTLTTVSDSHTFPSDADRLLALTVDKVDFGQVYFDNVSLLTDLTPGPVPVLAGVAPKRILYGQSVQLTGRDFGTTPGTVELAGTTSGVAVDSWSDTAIQVTVTDPAASGHLLVIRDDQVRSSEPRPLTITSPNFTATRFKLPNDFGYPEPDTPLALPGQPVYVHVDIDCFNGCAPTGGISFSVTGAPGFTANPSNIDTNGGSRIAIDTTGLPAGVHDFTVQAAAAGYVTRTFPFSIDVRTPGTLTMTYYDATSMTTLPVPNPWNLTAQGEFVVYFALDDNLGNDISSVGGFTLGTSNPAVAEAFNSTTPWDGPAVLTQDDGSCNIFVYGPNGQSWSFPLTVAVPADPKIEVYTFSSSTITNSGSDTTSKVITTSAPMTQHSGSTGSHLISTLGSTFSNGNATLTSTIQAGAELAPGPYKIRSDATLSGGGEATRTRILNVVNDPTTGLLLGHLILMRDPFHSHGANGTVEFYDAVTGLKLFERLVFEFSWDYALPNIPPGTYKIRWVTGISPGYPTPQWFGNAYDIVDADPVVVSAGSVIPAMNFFLDLLPDALPPAPQMQDTAFDTGAGRFDLMVPIDDGFNYDLFKSVTGGDGSWYRVDTMSGSGTATFSDSNATEDTAIYRVTRR